MEEALEISKQVLLFEARLFLDRFLLPLKFGDDLREA